MALPLEQTHCPDCGTRLSGEPWARGLCVPCLADLAVAAPSVHAEMAFDPDEPPTLRAAVDGLAGGQILGDRYRIRSLLGRGGMGEVWRAFDLKLRVDVALKALRGPLLETKGARELLRREVRSAREVVSPNVCRVFHIEEVEEFPDRELVSMEYIDGQTLTELLRERCPLELGEAREIAAQFLAGLEAIHAAGLVHRDFKPENVMITRSGRVVVMDFGIAKGLADGSHGTVAGTPAYMAPEQSRGEAVDARADVFSAGVVLAEMIAPEGIASREARVAVTKGVHREPPVLADTPWRTVLEKAVARDREDRYGSTSELARALEEVTLRVEGAEDLEPYPGLSAFTEEDAEYFFGRELEVEEMWRKLRRPHLLALIGPSGAGKSSFLRAGLLPAMPEGWRAVISSPGNRPFMALGEALVDELSGDAEAMKEFLRFEDPDVAVSLVSRWRQQHGNALVIVDQFEELFTQNPTVVQERFAELLGRLALEADVHVLLAMRDDFLFHCQPYEPLKPILSEMTLLGALTGSGLRRALVQPALRCGYRFEDESTVDEMVEAVQNERGALPMLAFAAAQLWQHRDREQGLLTREAYEHIGGVGGALARHAETTLERIGPGQGKYGQGYSKVPFARELFRNLVTAEGTRAARGRDELLSVFPEGREAAGEVLNALIDARLLTSYELPAAEDEAEGQQRIEIVHESLLKHWPRLVRWQTQDAEGAQLRDELRQAARTWDQHERSEDLLWTGTAYREFQLWRERYPGGLTELEEEFGAATIAKAERRQRRRRVAMATVLALVLAVAAGFSILWQRSEGARRQAEAAEILALGRPLLADYPTAALAYSIASLETADNEKARRVAVEAIAQGPTAFVIPENVNGVRFSQDGRWLATSGISTGVRVWPRDGGPPLQLVEPRNDNSRLSFAAPELLVEQPSGNTLRFWSLPEGVETRSYELEGPTGVFVAKSRLLTFSTDQSGLEVVRSWAIAGGEPEILSRWDPGAIRAFDVNGAGSQVAFSLGNSIFVSQVEELGRVPGRLVGAHRAEVHQVRFHPTRKLVVGVDAEGEIRLWPLDSPAPQAERVIQAEPGTRVWFDPMGKVMVGVRAGGQATSEIALVWDLAGPSEAEPLSLRIREANWLNTVAVRDGGRWIATALSDSFALWSQKRFSSHVLRPEPSPYYSIAFTPDGGGLVSTSNAGIVRMWPLSAASEWASQILMKDETAHWGFAGSLSLVSAGETLLTLSIYDRRAFLLPLRGGPARLLPVPEAEGFAPLLGAAVSPDGRLAALADHRPPDGQILIIDLSSDQQRGLDLGPVGLVSHGSYLRFLGNDQLLESTGRGLRLWDLGDGTNRMIRESRGHEIQFSFGADQRRALVLDGGTGDPLPSILSLLDLESGRSVEITSHGNHVRAIDMDPASKVVVSGDSDGVIRVGPVTGEEPHLLFGHERAIYRLEISPDGRLIASSSEDGTIRIWPMPEGRPLHTLPRDELLDELRSLTNLRLVVDGESATGYRLEPGPFTGWGIE